MSKYVKKSDPDPALTPEEEIRRLKLKISQLDSRLATLDRLLRALGFVGDPKTARFLHAKLKRCACGRPPMVQEAVYDEGKWLVICPHCVLRTEAYSRVYDAMKAWNAGELTEASRMLQRPLGAAEADDIGAVDLAHSVVREAVEEWQGTKDPGRKKELEKFFRTSPMMLGTDPEVILDALNKPREGECGAGERVCV